MLWAFCCVQENERGPGGRPYHPMGPGASPGPQSAAQDDQGDFPAFVAAVEHLPSADRDILAVLGACDLLGRGTARGYLSQRVEANLTKRAIQFKGNHVDELPAWPAAPDTRH